MQQFGDVKELIHLLNVRDMQPYANHYLLLFTLSKSVPALLLTYTMDQILGCLTHLQVNIKKNVCLFADFECLIATTTFLLFLVTVIGMWISRNTDLVRLLSEWKSLPHQHPKAPHITLTGELEEVHAFRCIPFNRPLTMTFRLNKRNKQGTVNTWFHCFLNSRLY